MEIGKLTGREKEVLELIRNDATISREKIAAELKISESAVGTYIHHLSNKGYLLGRGYITAPQEKIVVVGGANLDIKGYSPHYIKGSSSPGRIEETSGGVGRNISENLAYLNQDVVLLTTISSDHFGRELQEETKKTGVDVSHFKITSAKDYRTGVYLSHLDQDGDLIGAVNDMRILKEIDESYLDQKRKIIENATMLIFDTNLTEKAIKYLLKLAAVEKIIKIADAVSVEKSLKLKGKLDQIDYLRANLNEAETVLGIKDLDNSPELKNKNYQERIKKVLSYYQENKDLPAMIVSVGKKGVYYFEHLADKVEFNHFESKKIAVEEVVEATGAGDALTAGFAAGLTEENEIDQAIELGLEAAALTVKSELTCTEKLKELNQDKKTEVI